jgi:hypothetical protein
MYQKSVNIQLSEWIKIPVEGLSPLLDRKLHERLVFTNPDYEARHNSGEWIGNIPPQISCLKQKGRTYLIPRGFLDQLLDLCKKFQQPYRIVDRRRSFDPQPLEFHGELKSYQQDAAEAVLERDFGTLIGGYKSGKTVIALYTIAQRRQPALIVIPKIDLLDGWLSKIANFLQIPSSEVGIFTGVSQQPGKLITIAHSAEVLRHWRKLQDKTGYIILDECQRSPSKVLTHLVPNFDCRYMLALSNANQRKDRLFKLIYYYLGDVVYTIDEKDAREGRGIIPAHIVARTTEFSYPYHARADYESMLHALITDEERNRIIAGDVEAELDNGEQPVLILSGGEVQDEALGAELARRGIELFFYDRAAGDLDDNPGMDDDESSAPEAGLSGPPIPATAQAILISPQVLARCARPPAANVLFLAVPVYFRKHMAKLIRDIGLNGSTGESRLKIFDYVDHHIGILENYFRMRSYNYGVHPDVLLNAGAGQFQPRPAPR